MPAGSQDIITVPASESGLSFVPVPGTGTNGVAVADFNQDGCPDVYFVVKEPFKINDQRTWNRLFRNNCNGSFTNVTSEAGAIGADPDSPPNAMGSKFGASWGDFNNSGYPDLFLTHAGTDQLYRNNGDGTFTDITADAGVSGPNTQVSTSAVWFDFDNDGLLDLYVSVWEDSGPETDLRNRLYKNRGDGTFRDISDQSGLADAGRTWTSLPVDVNNDRLMDLYVVNDFGGNRLYVNEGNGTFTDRTEAFNLEDRFEGMGVAATDLNRDGVFDIFVTNNTEKPFNEEQVNALFVSTGDGNYSNLSETAGVELSGWGWGTEFIDHNNSGIEDLIVVNGYFDQSFANRYFRNSGNPESIQFEDISIEAGFADSTEGRGLAVFDYNLDGRSDILVSNFQTVPFLYRNESSAGNWLAIELEGTESNRSGSGAVVEVQMEEDVLRKYTHGVQFLAQHEIPLHFGIGEAEIVNQVVVTWPSGGVDELVSVPANQTITIKENQGLITSAEHQRDVEPEAAATIELLGNYPNPFNGTATIRFRLERPSEVVLSVYNSLGQRVYQRADMFSADGVHAIQWNMTGADVNSGVYFYRLTAGDGFRATGRMTYVK